MRGAGQGGGGGEVHHYYFFLRGGGEGGSIYCLGAKGTCRGGGGDFYYFFSCNWGWGGSIILFVNQEFELGERGWGQGGGGATVLLLLYVFLQAGGGEGNYYLGARWARRREGKAIIMTFLCKAGARGSTVVWTRMKPWKGS